MTSKVDDTPMRCTQRECKANESIIDQYREIFESRISATATDKMPGRNLTQRRSHGLTTWKDMLKKTSRDIVNWQTKGQGNCTKVSTPCLDDHNFKREESEPVGELSDVCSQIVFKCLNLAGLG